MDILLAVVIGMFLHISTTIIFEVSYSYKWMSVTFQHCIKRKVGIKVRTNYLIIREHIFNFLDDSIIFFNTLNWTRIPCRLPFGPNSKRSSTQRVQSNWISARIGNTSLVCANIKC
jgi:hypothetical protein